VHLVGFTIDILSLFKDTVSSLDNNTTGWEGEAINEKRNCKHGSGRGPTRGRADKKTTKIWSRIIRVLAEMWTGSLHHTSLKRTCSVELYRWVSGLTYRLTSCTRHANVFSSGQRTRPGACRPGLVCSSTPLQAPLNLQPPRCLNSTSHCQSLILDAHSGNKRPWLSTITF
jgi:hypothetical protein